MSKTKICLRCSRPKSTYEGVLCRVCEYEKGKNQEKRQRSQNYKKYGIRETDSERALRIKSEKKEKAEQKKKEAEAQKKKEEKKKKLEQEKIYNEKIKLNITAVFTKKQIDDLYKNINGKYEIIISIFAGRIADTGKDPEKLIKYALKKRKSKKIKILWASTREVYNIYQANRLNVDIITVTKDQINKLNLKNKNLHQYSIETSKQFFNDAKKAKIKI